MNIKERWGELKYWKRGITIGVITFYVLKFVDKWFLGEDFTNLPIDNYILNITVFYVLGAIVGGLIGFIIGKVKGK